MTLEQQRQIEREFQDAKTPEDGETFQDPAKVTTPLDAVRAANAKLPQPVMTNGIPARLAAARLRQRENATTTNEVTVTVKAGQN